jgi:hypothetical protein
MSHYIYKLDETYWTNDSGNLKIFNVLSHNTESYIINPTVLDANGFDKNSVLTKVQFSALFENLSPPDLIVIGESDFSLSNWTDLGWGSTASEVLTNYKAFIAANIVNSPNRLDINPGSYPMTTALVNGTVSGSAYFVPVLMFAQQGSSDDLS